MSAFEKSVHIEPVTGGGFVVGLNHTPGFMSERMAFTDAADLLAWVTRELTPPLSADEICKSIGLVPFKEYRPERSTYGLDAEAQTQAVSGLYAAHAAEKATKPSEPSTAPTVAPYEGCWAVLRNGGLSNRITKRYERRFDGAMWGDGDNGPWHHNGRQAHGLREYDIIAVHPSDPRITPETPYDDGWIEWKGGECPVARDVEVDVEFRNGVRRQGPAGGWFWNHDRAGLLDIVRYRLSRPSK